MAVSVSRLQGMNASPGAAGLFSRAIVESGTYQLDQDTLNRRQSVLGPNHPYSLHSASMLARDMREAGDFAGSTELLRETYARYRTVLTM